MLAPRKTLWSTPSQVQDVLVSWISLEVGDVVCDVGCGDGRILLRWAQHVCDTMKDKTALATRTTSSKLPIENGSSLSLSPGSLPASSLIRFVGIEIDEERTKLAQSNVVEARKDGRLIDSVV